MPQDQGKRGRGRPTGSRSKTAPTTSNHNAAVALWRLKQQWRKTNGTKKVPDHMVDGMLKELLSEKRTTDGKSLYPKAVAERVKALETRVKDGRLRRYIPAD